MIERVCDPALVNGFANHPDIRPHVGGEGYLDLTGVVREPNVFLFGEHGGFCLSWSAPETYEVHTLIVPEGRGEWAFKAAEESRRIMVELGATHLWTRVRDGARHTALFTRKMGFRPCGTSEIDFGQGPETWRVFNWRKPCQ